MIIMKKKKNIGIVAHDNRKVDILEWVEFNWKELIQHNLICTGTTGRLVEETFAEKCLENCGSAGYYPFEIGPVRGRPATGGNDCRRRCGHSHLFRTR